MIDGWSPSEFPWMPAYTSDWLLSKSVRLMTMTQRGLYWELLCISWRDQGIPENLEDIATLTGLPLDEIEAAWVRVGKMFVPGDEPGTLVNPQQEEIRTEQVAKFQRRSAAGRTAGRASAAKRKVNDSSTNGTPGVNHREGDREGDQGDKGKNIQEEGATRFDPLKAIWESLPESHRTREVGEALKGYLAVRREMRWPAWKARFCGSLVKQFAKMTPANVAACLNYSANKPYQGLFPEKFSDSPKLAIVPGGLSEGSTTTMTEAKKANVARG